MNEKNATIKDARTLGIPRMLLLGLQHMFAMFGATILVPILVNSYRSYGEGLSKLTERNSDLCGLWNPVFPCLHQAEGTCIPGFLFRFSWRIFYRSKSGYRHVR